MFKASEIGKEFGLRSLFRHYGEIVSENQSEPKHFEKNGYTFNGSKIDRQFSYSKIDYHLKQNSREQEQSHSQNQSSTISNTISAVGGLFDIQPTSGIDYNPDEAEFQRQHKPKKKNEIRHHL